MTQEALYRAQPKKAPDIAYQWQWQLGRLLEAEGKRKEAIASYEAAVETLESVRGDLRSINSDVQFSFRDNVEPLYRELVTLLLDIEKKEPPQDNLKKALYYVDSLQVAELENFLRCNLQGNIETVQIQRISKPNKRIEELFKGIERILNNYPTKAAFIYPIVLKEQISVILKLPGKDNQLQYHQTEVEQDLVKDTLKEVQKTLHIKSRITAGKELYWLRVRWQEGNFRVSPRLRRILTNTMWAVQAKTFKKEILGSSNADPNQVFVANNSPILRRQRLQVQEGQIESDWVKWLEVPDFYSSGKSDRHYVLDRQTGEIQFGYGIAGMIPPRGRNNIRLSFYRTGSGKQGNVGSQTVSQLKTTIPYIDKVNNLEAAAGGAPQEDLERFKERAPKKLRHQDRAVTIDDITDLAYEASTDVARAKTISSDMMMKFDPLDPSFWDLPKLTEEQKDQLKNAGQVKLIILPNSRDRQPVPSLALLEQVETYILERCQPTMDLIVTPPKWQKVAIETTIVPKSLENGDRLKDEVRRALEKFLHPLNGGKRQEGWEFGRYPQKSDFYSIIQSIPGVDWVKSLDIKVDPNPTAENTTADTLIYSGDHDVKLAGNRE